MREVFKIHSITQLNELLMQPKPTHPLVSVVDLSKIDYGLQANQRFASSFYTVMLKDHCQAALKYGRNYYDFEEGTLVFIAPDQVLAIEDESEDTRSKGWALLFHPDLIRGTSLSVKIKEYSFFSYDSTEALHLSDQEKQILNECLNKIELELSQNIDHHSQTLIVSNIELLLNYCNRFYDRQFITRKAANQDMLSKFEKVLKSYFQSDELKTQGLPSVKFCANRLNLSPNYFSDLLKKETGKNAQEHIHYQVIEEAKNRLLLSGDTVSEIAYELGFEYPQYFSKMFKKKTGMSPAEFRKMN